MGIIINPYFTGFMGGGTPISFTFVGSAVSALSTVDISATGRASGDLGILLDLSQNSSGTPANTIPSGHTSLVTDTQTLGILGLRASIRYKLLTGSEGSLTGQDGTNFVDKVYLVFRPSSAITTVTFNDGQFEAANVNPSSQATGAGSGTPPVIVIGQMGTETNPVSPRSTTPAMSEVVGGGTNHYGLYKIYNTSPANQTTFDMDDEGNANTLQLGYLTFT